MKVQSRFKPSKSTRKENDKMAATLEMLRMMEEFKLIACYVLRNKGYGRKRLMEFSEKWDEYFMDIVLGNFTADDVRGVLVDEVGINGFDLMIKHAEVNGHG